jgi:hypothetical protein
MAPYGINASRTPREIIALLNDLVAAPKIMTKGAEKVDIVGMTIRADNYISNTFFSDLQGQSIKSIWLGNNPNIRVEVLPELEGVGQGGTDMLIAWRSDPKAFKVRLKMPLKYGNLKPYHLNYFRSAKFRYGGIAMYRPMSIHIMHGL